MISYVKEGNGPRLLAANISALLITWIFASSRIYVRLFLIKSWMLEDWFFVAAQITFTILNAISFGSMLHGNGQRLAVLHPGDLIIAMRYWYLTELFYIASSFFLRLSIGFVLLRICSSRRYRYPIWATIVAMAIAGIFFFFFCVFQCSPISSFWLQFSGPAGRCLPPLTIRLAAVVHSSICATADLVFGILPIFLIWSLKKMNIRTKISVSILLSLGIFAGATVIVRMEVVWNMNPTGEWLYASSNIALWSMIEPTIGIACTAAVTFRPFFKFLRDRTNNSMRAASHGDSAVRNMSVSCQNNSNTSGSGPIHGRGGVGMELGSSSAGSSGFRGSKDGFSVAVPYAASFRDVEGPMDISLESLAIRSPVGDGEPEIESGEREEDAGLGAVFYNTTTSNSR